MDNTPHISAPAREIAAALPGAFDRGLQLLRSGRTKRGADLAKVAEVGLRMYALANLGRDLMLVSTAREITAVYYAQCRIIDLEEQIARLKRGQGN